MNQFTRLTNKIKREGFASTAKVVFDRVKYAGSFYLFDKPSFFVWKLKTGKKPFQVACYKPFHDLEIIKGGDCHLCCPTWVPESVGNCSSESLDGVFNSIKAQKMRIAFYKNDLKHCNTSLCDLVNSKTYKGFDKEFILKSPLFTEQTKKEILKRKLKLTDGPSRITDGIAETCNVFCNFCRDVSNRFISNDTHSIRRMKDYILGNLGKLRLLNFCGAGEPFVQKYVKEIIKVVKEEGNKDVGFYFTTNLSFIDDETKALLEDVYVTQLHASINAANRGSYDTVVYRGNWDNVLKNLDYFLDLRARKNPNMWIQVSMVVTNQTYMDVIDFAKLGIAKNVDKVLLPPMVEYSGINKHLALGEKEIAEIKEMLRHEIFKDSRIELQPLEDAINMLGVEVPTPV
jgi:wyosine [tRNA(Phe)-imidazoG37] synthetase (radical SAM superfamily)